MLQILKTSVLEPLARRLGSLAAGALLGASVFSIEPEHAQQLGGCVTAALLVLGDLVLSALQRGAAK